MSLSRALNAAACAFVLGLLTIDFQFDHWTLANNKQHLNEVVTYYRNLEIAPPPVSLIIPGFIVFFFFFAHIIFSF